MSLFRPFNPADLVFVQRMVTSRRNFARETDILRAGELGGGPYTLWDGWAYLYRELTETGAGPRRQILELLLPGDMFGVGVALTGRVGTAVRTLTATTVCMHDQKVFSKMFTERPELARGLMETMARDAERAYGWLAVIGQSSGPQRIAHLILETWHRLAQRDPALRAAEDGGEVRVPFPLRRRHLAAALGMSGTHVARSLAELAAQRLARLEEDMLAILDPAGLTAFCGYVPVPDEIGRRVML
jgi:CRP-like cAMP-binding protein